jgi:catechol 2,3-dioxygenase-like lactoylglutathione lyase family enzyme
MPEPSRPVVNHVGLCVADLPRARRFYEEALGFRFWWEFPVPDEPAAQVLRLQPPMGMTAVYLVRDGWVLELLHYASSPQPARERRMDEPGLTHVSLAVPDLDAALAAVEACGGEVLADTLTPDVVFVRDPDGQLIELGTTGWRDQLPPLPTD